VKNCARHYTFDIMTSVRLEFRKLKLLSINQGIPAKSTRSPKVDRISSIPKPTADALIGIAALPFIAFKASSRTRCSKGLGAGCNISSNRIADPAFPIRPRASNASIRTSAWSESITDSPGEYRAKFSSVLQSLKSPCRPRYWMQATATSAFTSCARRNRTFSRAPISPNWSYLRTARYLNCDCCDRIQLFRMFGSVCIAQFNFGGGETDCCVVARETGGTTRAS